MTFHSFDSKQLTLLDAGCVVDDVDPPYRGEKREVFLAILVVARIVIWETRKKGLYDGANFSANFSDVTPLKSSDGTAHGDYILTVCLDREGFLTIPHIISHEQHQYSSRA